MISKNSDNVLLRFRRRFHNIVLTCTLTSKRSEWLSFGWTKLRLKEYIHLRNAISTKGDAENVDWLTILPATYTVARIICTNMLKMEWHMLVIIVGQIYSVH